MSDAGGKITNAGKPLRANQLPAFLGDFLFELVVETVKFTGHAVELFGQIRELFPAAGIEALCELPGGDFPHAGPQSAERTHHAAVLHHPQQ